MNETSMEKNIKFQAIRITDRNARLDRRYNCKGVLNIPLFTTYYSPAMKLCVHSLSLLPSQLTFQCTT